MTTNWYDPNRGTRTETSTRSTRPSGSSPIAAGTPSRPRHRHAERDGTTVTSQPPDPRVWLHRADRRPPDDLKIGARRKLRVYFMTTPSTTPGDDTYRDQRQSFTRWVRPTTRPRTGITGVQRPRLHQRGRADAGAGLPAGALHQAVRRVRAVADERGQHLRHGHAASSTPFRHDNVPRRLNDRRHPVASTPGPSPATSSFGTATAPFLSVSQATPTPHRRWPNRRDATVDRDPDRANGHRQSRPARPSRRSITQPRPAPFLPYLVDKFFYTGASSSTIRRPGSPPTPARRGQSRSWAARPPTAGSRCSISSRCPAR